jgi:septal ring factor EnvC (AmiA/AmiB activator)
MQATSWRPRRVLSVTLLALVASAHLFTMSASTAQTPGVEQAEQRLADTLGKRESVEARLGRTEAEIADIRVRTKRLEDEVERIAQDVLDAKEAAIEVARAMYMSGSAGMLEGLLGSRSVADLETGLSYLKSSGQAHFSDLERLIVNRKLLEMRLDELDTQRQRAVEIAAEMRRLAAEIGREVVRRRAELAGAQKIQKQARAVSQAPPVPAGPYSVDWDAIAQCESGGNWQLAGRYHGGLQFHPDTWLAFGGGRYARYAYQASRPQQIAVAEKVLAGQGPSAWPNCFRYGA